MFTRRVLGAVLCFALLPQSLSCKEVTEKVVETGVKAAKDTTKGIEEGIEQGRKSGSSVDDAVIVANAADLDGKGSIGVHTLRARGGGEQAEVELVVENTTDAPLRVTKLEVVVLDDKGFATRPTSPPFELTVVAKAKDKLPITFATKPESIKKVRIWAKDYDAPSVTE
jgi:hypothetical protein